MPSLDSLRDEYRTLNYCIWNNSEDPKVKDYKITKVYPTFPWKFDEEVSHINDNPVRFCQMAESAGLITYARKADVPPSDDKPITYSEWLERHKDEPGFVDHTVDEGMIKRMEDY